MAQQITSTHDIDGTYTVTGWRDAGTLTCRCGAEVTLTEDVVAWETNTGNVIEWGPAQGVCETCHLLYVDDFYSPYYQVYRLEGEASA